MVSGRIRGPRLAATTKVTITLITFDHYPISHHPLVIDVRLNCKVFAIFPCSKVHLFEIVLEKGGGGRPVFVPGEEVKGRVVIRCSGGLKLRSLSVTMKGAGRVHWTEYRARNNERYSAEIEYFKKKRRVRSQNRPFIARDSPLIKNVILSL